MPLGRKDSLVSWVSTLVLLLGCTSGTHELNESDTLISAPLRDAENIVFRAPRPDDSEPPVEVGCFLRQLRDTGRVEVAKEQCRAPSHSDPYASAVVVAQVQTNGVGNPLGIAIGIALLAVLSVNAGLKHFNLYVDYFNFDPSVTRPDYPFRLGWSLGMTLAEDLLNQSQSHILFIMSMGITALAETIDEPAFPEPPQKGRCGDTSIYQMPEELNTQTGVAHIEATSILANELNLSGVLSASSVYGAQFIVNSFSIANAMDGIKWCGFISLLAQCFIAQMGATFPGPLQQPRHFFLQFDRRIFPSEDSIPFWLTRFLNFHKATNVPQGVYGASVPFNFSFKQCLIESFRF